MPKKEVPIFHLQQYLPANTGQVVIKYLQKHQVHLTIAKERKSVLGDYRHRTLHNHHRISVNGNLNPFAFLITLLHELAHLHTFEMYGNKVQAHGKEWKKVFGNLLKQFIENNVFPENIEKELLRSLNNPAASSCADVSLLRVLRTYDNNLHNHLLVEELPNGAVFTLKDGRKFQRGDKLRKRYKCTEIETGKIYLFSPVYEVQVVPE